MAENQILPFAVQDTGTNLLTQAEYAADAQRLAGHQPGVARSKLENKALRQVSTMAAGLAQFIANRQADDVTDAKTPAEIAAMLESAGGAISSIGAQGYISIPATNGTRVIFQWGKYSVPGKTEKGFFLPVAFPTAALCGIVSFLGRRTTYVNGNLDVFFPTKNQINITNSAAGESVVYAISLGY